MPDFEFCLLQLLFHQALVKYWCFPNRKSLPVFSYLQHNVDRNATFII